ncbi:MAG: aminotransferase class V-fold PLP-dependent enzyme [Bacteroidota bacterium]|nr:aminotransferase class V-fold PLP-dependent enzyme [Bacteroidota bacterium]
MITFNVGPSKIYPEVAQYLQDAYNNNVLSISHRSPEFVEISKKAIELFHQKLNVPTDYTVMYTGSATESWEIIAQDIVIKKAVHFYNGEFGKKWYEYAKFINPETVGFHFDENTELNVASHDLPKDVELLCFTLNETSTGTQVKSNVIEAAKKLYPNALIAIDTTSCIAGIAIDFNKYDIIYGSTQKCFGLPAGLGLLICGPKAIEAASKKGIKGRYNSLLSMLDQIKNYQTNYTPNVLGIYLLCKVLEQIPPIQTIDSLVNYRALDWYSFIPKVKNLSLHITNPAVQSDTVITVKSTEENILNIKKAAKSTGIELGAGYGPLKNVTFRIANFPSITETEINTLKGFLSSLN